MGLFGKKKKIESTVKVCFTTTSDLLGEIESLASRYVKNEYFLVTYSKDKLDIKLLNNARLILETELSKLGINLNKFYSEEYKTVSDTTDDNMKFSYSLYSLIELFNNSLDLYSEKADLRDSLNLCYDKCNGELEKVKVILSDDDTLKGFTGLEPIEIQVEEEIQEVEEVVEDEIEDVESNIIKEEKTSIDNLSSLLVDDESDIDGDLIIDTDNMKVYFIRNSRNEFDEINLNLCIKNKTNKDVVIQCKNVTVDGNETIPRFNCGVSAGKAVYDSIIFKNEVDVLVNFTGTLCMIGAGEVIDEATVTMFRE